MNFKLLTLLSITFIMSGCCQAPESLIERFTTTKPFIDVVEELDFAITERNFRITGRNTIGKGLRKRGYENYPDIEVIHFCSLENAKEVLDIDPGYVAQMPCRVTVHEVENAVVISLILLPTDHEDQRVNDFAERMNVTLREIVMFVLEDDAEIIESSE